MGNYGEIYRFEIKKIMKNRLTVAMLIVTTFLIIVEAFLPKLYMTKEMEEALKVLDGKVIDDALLQEMYPKLIDFVKLQIQNLKDKGYEPTIKAFCWMQGEGDSWDGYYDKYLDNTRLLVSHIREDLGEYTGGKELPFIDAGISDSRDWQYYREVNEAKQAFAAEGKNNIYIDTIAAGMHTDQEPAGNVDTCHYDSESEILLGHLFAENFEPYLDKGE